MWTWHMGSCICVSRTWRGDLGETLWTVLIFRIVLLRSKDSQIRNNKPHLLKKVVES